MLETLMVSALGPLVSGRVFPDTAPASTALPFVIFQKVGGMDPVFADGTLPDKENARVQVQVWARKRTEASAMMRQVKTALCTAPALGVPLGADIARNEDGFLGAQQDFSIWYSPL
jgi:hypothetical protein